MRGWWWALIAASAAGCGGGAVVIDFPPSGLATGTELIALDGVVEAVELGAVWRPSQPLPDRNPLLVFALVYPGTLAEHRIAAGPIALPSTAIGPAREDGAPFALTINGGDASAWQRLDQPADVLAPYRFREELAAIATGSAETHSCALTTGGRVYCWGDNTHGQLGLTMSVDRPALVPGLENIEEIALGLKHSCFRGSEGRVRCFGWNKWGQLGQGTPGEDVPTPLEVPGLDGVTQLSATGNRTCALRSGQVICWGSFFQLNPIPTDPAPVTFPVPIQKIATGTYGVCGLGSGGVYCAGFEGTSGLVGAYCELHRINGSEVFRASAVHVALTGTVADLAMGDSTACAVLTSGDLYCWGCNSVGQVGTGGVRPGCGTPPAPGCDQDERPIRIATRMRAVDLGWWFGCGIDLDDRVLCWGWDDNGQIGDGRVPSQEPKPPTRVVGLSASEVRVHWTHACARSKDGAELFCWGNGTSGQLGEGSKQVESAPVRVQF